MNRFIGTRLRKLRKIQEYFFLYNLKALKKPLTMKEINRMRKIMIICCVCLLVFTLTNIGFAEEGIPIEIPPYRTIATIDEIPLREIPVVIEAKKDLCERLGIKEKKIKDFDYDMVSGWVTCSIPGSSMCVYKIGLVYKKNTYIYRGYDYYNGSTSESLVRIEFTGEIIPAEYDEKGNLVLESSGIATVDKEKKNEQHSQVMPWNDAPEPREMLNPVRGNDGKKDLEEKYDFIINDLAQFLGAKPKHIRIVNVGYLDRLEFATRFNGSIVEVMYGTYRYTYATLMYRGEEYTYGIKGYYAPGLPGSLLAILDPEKTGGEMHSVTGKDEPLEYAVYLSNEVKHKKIKGEIENDMISYTNENKFQYSSINSVQQDTSQKLNPKKTAIDYLKEIINPNGFRLISHQQDSNYATFEFELKDGSIVKIWVNIETGEPHMDEGLKDAALMTRKDIAYNMKEVIEKIHINGVVIEYLGLEGINEHWLYTLTAKVKHYTLTFECLVCRDMMPVLHHVRGVFHPTLISFIDNDNGRDYAKEAQDAVLDLFNPEEHNIGIFGWCMFDGVLSLEIELHHSIYPFRAYLLGGQIHVEVDVGGTGEIRIDERIKEAVAGARNETSRNLDVDYDSVHVNWIVPEWGTRSWDRLNIQMEVKDIVTIMFIKGYNLHVSTILPDTETHLELIYNYNFESGNLKLTSLVNKETEINLLEKAIQYLEENHNPEEFELYDWWHIYGRDHITFKFILQDGSVVETLINIETGELMFASFREPIERLY